MPDEHRPQIGGRGGGLDQMQQLFLDAGRVAVIGGWVVVTHSFGNPAADATDVFLGFALLLVGVLLLTLSPAARQFPWVARLGAVVANATLNDIFEPGN